MPGKHDQPVGRGLIPQPPALLDELQNPASAVIKARGDH
jgi:hypothetical protein